MSASPRVGSSGRGNRAGRRLALGLILCAGVLAVGSPVRADEREGARVVAVEVRGAQTVAKETILAKAQMKPGAPYRLAVVSEDIRRLFSLGYFTDVRADVETLPDGLKLLYVVKEKPTVTAIKFEGNRFLHAPKLLELSALRQGELYDPRKLKAAADLIKAEYARKGYAQCEVATNARVDEAANTATLYLLVDEGVRLRIKDVLVEGNTAFSDARLRKVLKTKRRVWFRSGVYSEPVLEEDLERVRAFYRKFGYQDVQVTQETYRDPLGRGLLVHLKIVEGLQHRVGQVAMAGEVLFPERELRRVITLKPGAIFSDEGLQNDLRAIKQYYGDRGYIHTEVSPETQLEETTKRVSVTYHLAERELVYVNRIDVRGNLHTKDTVIRRELRIYPGEVFNGAKIRKSLDRLYNLGYFEEANVDTEPTASADHEDLIVRVKESKTGSFSFGGGFSSIDRLMGLVELEQRNFSLTNWPSLTGDGQDLRFRVEIGSVRRNFDLSFTEPWIFGYPFLFGVDGYNRTTLRSSNLGIGFEERQQGGGIRFGKEFTDLVRVGWTYQLFQTKIGNIDPNASPDLLAEEGTNLISEGGTSVTFDTRDNRFDPTRGSSAFTSVDLAGGPFGGDRDFYRFQAGGSHFFPHFDRFVLETHARAGLVKPYSHSKDVPIFERFFGGGSGTIRGFRERRVGPLDPNTNDPIGGESTLLGTVEEVMTIIKDEKGRAILKGSTFFDVGNVWRHVGQFGSSYRAGIGVGARVNTPIGPLRLDLGFPVSPLQAGEKRQMRFHFNISRNF